MNLKEKFSNVICSIKNFFSIDDGEQYGVDFAQVISLKVATTKGYVVRDVEKVRNVADGCIYINSIEVYRKFRAPSVTTTSVFIPNEYYWFEPFGGKFVTRKELEVLKKEAEKSVKETKPKTSKKKK